jgi:hypothetical protein
MLVFDFTLDFHHVGTWLLYLSLVMSIWSAGEYFRFFVRAAQKEQARRGKTEPPAP